MGDYKRVDFAYLWMFLILPPVKCFLALPSYYFFHSCPHYYRFVSWQHHSTPFPDLILVQSVLTLFITFLSFFCHYFMLGLRDAQMRWIEYKVKTQVRPPSTLDWTIFLFLFLVSQDQGGIMLRLHRIKYFKYFIKQDFYHST